MSLVLPPGPALKADETLLYLVRHGATANNLKHPPVLQGRRSDLALSPQGAGQARRTAKLLSGMPIGAVYASPLARAKETAIIIGGPHGITPGIVDDLTEVDVGFWEGYSWPEIEQRDPIAHRLFVTDSAEHPYGGGENLRQVRDRVLPAIESIVEKHWGERIVVVAHNVVNRVYLASLWNMPLTQSRNILQDNGGVNVIRVFRSKARIETVNIRFHLDDVGPV